MTGKLIQNLKRKREEECSTKKPSSPSVTITNQTNTGNSSSNGNNINNNASTSSSSAANTTNHPVHNNEYFHHQEQQNNAKRKRRNQCDTPSDTSSSDESSVSSESSKNSFLIIALQKMIDLENDLNEIDNEFKINGLYGDDYDGEIDEEVSRINGLAKTAGSIGGGGYEAEALGFAMCARETLLFLQNEGIPENSLLYKALKDRLVGKSDGIPI